MNNFIMAVRLWWIFQVYDTTIRLYRHNAERGGVFPVSSNECPWMAAILILGSDGRPNERDIHCGGSLINEKFVLTFGSCVVQRLPHELVVRLGAKDVRTTPKSVFEDYDVLYFVLHPSWISGNGNNHNLALLKLTTSVLFNYHIWPIPLTMKHYSGSRFIPTKVVAAGWGKFHNSNHTSPISQKSVVKVVSNADCGKLYHRNSTEDKLRDFPSLCFTAPGKGNDSFLFLTGSGLIQWQKGSWVLFSIVSLWQLVPHYHCISIHVSPYLDWIKKVSQMRCTPAAQLSYRTASGDPHLKMDFPFLAAILLIENKNTIWCGGSIINERFVLTAAHCVERILPGNLVVRLGERNLTSPETKDRCTEFKVDYYVMHPFYDENYLTNDLALLKLAKKVNFTKYILPVTLPSKEFAQVKLDHQLVTAMGWGRTHFSGNYSMVPLKVEVPVVPFQVCLEFYNFTAVHPNNLCIGVPGGGKGTCNGDSGGPIVHNYKGTWLQVSVVSWGHYCTLKGGYSVSTQVVPYLDWIHEQSVLCAEDY